MEKKSIKSIRFDCTRLLIIYLVASLLLEAEVTKIIFFRFCLKSLFNSCIVNVL